MPLKRSVLLVIGMVLSICLIVAYRVGKSAHAQHEDLDPGGKAATATRAKTGSVFHAPALHSTGASGAASVSQNSASEKWQSGLEAAARLPDSERLLQLGSIITAWGEANPQEAAAYLLQQPPSPERTALLQTLAGIWAKADPKQTAEGLLPKLAGAEQLVIGGEIAGIWAERSPLDALAWLQALGAGEEFQNATSQLIYSHWAENDPQAAADHLVQPGSVTDEEGTKVVLARWVETDATAALAWFHNNLPSEEQSHLAVALTFALAQRDEKAAEAFVLGFKDSSAWASIALNAGTAMASTNPELAKRLAGEMSPGPERDQLLERISNLSVNTGP